MINIINNLDLEDYLINIIKKCYEVLLEKKKLSISYKNDGTPVSNIDKELSKIICKSLNAYDERVLVISEEKEFLSKDFLAPLYWIIDPIDGTKSFIKGGKEYTINIALISHGLPVIGLIYHPPSNKLWFGKNNKLFIYHKFIKKEYSPPKKNWKDPLLICSRRLDKKTFEFINRLNKKKIIKLSSSLKFCYLSESLANFYPRLSPISKWDIAAGHAIVRASGGEVTDLKGKKIMYNYPSEIVKEFIASDTENWNNKIKLRI